MKSFIETTEKKKTKEQQSEFLDMLLGTLGTSSLGDMLANKG